MPTSLVTGGAGLLGSHLCDCLLAHSQRVICMDDLETGSLENIRHITNGADFEFLMVDITSHYEIDERVRCRLSHGFACVADRLRAAAFAYVEGGGLWDA